MLTQGTGFAKYSKSLCWIVAFIWLALSGLAFTGGGESATINGVLWLIGAVAFAISAIFMAEESDDDEDAEADPAED